MNLIFSYVQHETPKGCRSTIFAKSVRILDGKWHHLQNFEIGLAVEPAQKLPTVWGALKARS